MERKLEQGLFSARWLVAPFYVGLAAAILGLLAVFLRELASYASRILTLSPEEAILAILALIDLSLAANLLLIVIFSGYENFVSRMQDAQSDERPAWMGTVDFAGLKLKLIGSIVAIAAIDVLKTFMSYSHGNAGATPEKLGVKTGVLLAFVLSGVLLALMDFLSSRSKASKA